MALFFSPDGTLNVAADPSDLPEASGEGGTRSGAMVRCKNLRLDEKGKARTRDGSTKLNVTPLAAGVNWLEVQAGTRYAFSGTVIYENETSLATGLTNAEWTAIQYNPYNDPTPNIFAINGTDRKRIEGGAVAEWGIAAPTIAPTLTVGTGKGLTGEYNAVYTYVRKDGTVVVAESNPSPAADNTVILVDQSLGAAVTQPEDTQVTHIRIYRTQNGGETYYLDDEIPASTLYAYGYVHDWEDTEGYIVGTGYHFTTTSDVAISDGTSSGGSTGGGSSGGGSGGGSGLVSITNADSSVVTSAPTTATAGYKIDSDGSAYYMATSNSYSAIAGEWKLSGVVADYEVRATKVSGTTPSGTLSSWLACSTDRAWTLGATSNYRICVLTIEIRLASTGEVLDTATVTLEAESAA